MAVLVLRGDARALPLPDESVDLIVTSPPYFGLRSYTDAGEHYATQIGAEPSPREFIAALLDCTREMIRVLKPSGSIFVNLGDKYAGGGGQWENDERPDPQRRRAIRGTTPNGGRTFGSRAKSLLLIPERYRIACTDELGLIARAVVVWSKPNGMPESVTDRVRRSHEDWVHLTKSPRYFQAVDELREPSASKTPDVDARRRARADARAAIAHDDRGATMHPLGKLPGSVWPVPTQPLHVPPELGADHFAAFPMEWPRRLITGWCPRDVCSACGHGRQPVAERGPRADRRPSRHSEYPAHHAGHDTRTLDVIPDVRITGYACACPDTSAPASPGVVLDPFGGTGTTALVADVLGRVGISIDASGDYSRIAQWRTTDPRQRARAARDVTDPAPPPAPAVAAALAAPGSLFADGDPL